MRVADVVAVLETIAPPSLAAEWDNVGLLIGDATARIRKLMLCIDLTDAVLDEAIAARADMVMAYHPVIFKPLPRLTAAAAPIAYRAARAGLAVYSMHTAIDAAPGGFNDVLAGILGLTAIRPIEQTVRKGQCKIVTFAPASDLSRVAEAAFGAGAGRIGNYFDCAFFAHGIGLFCGGEGTRPAIGQAMRHEATEEMRLEVFAPRRCAGEVASAIRAAHSYEEPVVEIYALEDIPGGCGLGRVGRLPRPASVAALVARIKKATGLRQLWISPATDASKPSPVKIAACAAGACGSLFRGALSAGATFLLTGELRHHEALEAARSGMTVVCLGHSNSERIALPDLQSRIRSLLPRLPVTVSRSDRDPLRIV